jgi:hypothetical protein
MESLRLGLKYYHQEKGHPPKVARLSKACMPIIHPKSHASPRRACPSSTQSRTPLQGVHAHHPFKVARLSKACVPLSNHLPPTQLNQRSPLPYTVPLNLRSRAFHYELRSRNRQRPPAIQLLPEFSWSMRHPGQLLERRAIGQLLPTSSFARKANFVKPLSWQTLISSWTRPVAACLSPRMTMVASSVVLP